MVSVLYLLTIWYYNIIRLSELMYINIEKIYVHILNASFEDGEVILKFNINDKNTEYIYNHNNAFYVLYAFISKLVGFTKNRKIEYHDNIVCNSNGIYVIMYLKNNKLNYLLLDNNNSNNSNNSKFPKASLVVIDDKYDVTEEYMVLRPCIHDSIYLYDLFRCIIFIKYLTIPNNIKCNKMLVYTEHTFDEIIFKRDI